MPRKARNGVTIELHNGWSRAWLRFLALTYPLWGLVSSVLIAYVLLGNPLPVVSIMLFAWISLPVGLIASLCMYNRLTVRDGKIYMPLLPYLREVVWLKDVDSVLLGRLDPTCPVYDELVLHRTKQPDVRLGLNCLSGDRLSMLLRAIEKQSPETRILPGIEHTVNSSISNLVPQQTAVVRIPYNSHSKLSELRYQLLSNEKYFWRVWGGCWAILTATAMVGVVLSVFQKVSVDKDPATTALNQFGNFVTGTGMLLALIFGPVSGQFIEGVSSPAGCATTVVLAMLIVAIVFTFLSQPNELLLSSDGIKLITRFFSTEVHSTFIPWSDIQWLGIERFSSSNAGDKFIALRTANKRTVHLQLAAFETEEQKTSLHRCFDFWAAHADRDPELITLLSPTHKRSYTELWLESLSVPPKRERLMTLPPSSSLKGERFIVVREIGIGGQGVAYLAKDRFTGTDVVLKEYVLPVYVDKNIRRQALQRFEHEASTLKQLEHPQIVKLTDYFVEDHRAYLVLEYIDGDSLRTMVESGDGKHSFDEVNVIELGLKMCEILKYLHGLEPAIVHRDFTPDNLILNQENVLKLIDFNVAKQNTSTKTGTVVGKHAYLPPEQFRGKPVPQSDIYAMGATLFFLLTGTDPEPLHEADVFRVEGAHPVNPLLNDILKRCTQIDLKKRYQNISDIEVDLKRILEPAHTVALLPEQSSVKSESCQVEDNGDGAGEGAPVVFEVKEREYEPQEIRSRSRESAT